MIVENAINCKFVWIHHGDNKKFIANTNCSALNFLDYVRKNCLIDESDIFDFTDINGKLLQISDQFPDSWHTQFENRSIYIPVSIDKDDQNEICDVRPLIEGINELYPNLQGKFSVNVYDDAQKSSESMIEYILVSKSVFPTAFKNKSQELLNQLNVELDKSFLPELTAAKRSRSKIVTAINKRISSRSRQRSMSPSGSFNRVEKSWDNNIEIAEVIIEHLLKNVDVLPDNFMNYRNKDKEVKKLLDDLKVIKLPEMKTEYLKNQNLFVIGESVKAILSKLGVLLPNRISTEIVSLKSLTCLKNNVVKKRKSHILAVQILLLNIPEKSRALLQNIVKLFNILANHRTLEISQDQLYELLKLSLFEGENNYNKLQLSKDFINLSNRLFECPLELYLIVYNYIKSIVNSNQIFKLSKGAEPNNKSSDSTIDCYYYHSKINRENNADLSLVDSNFKVDKKFPLIKSGNEKIPQLNIENRTFRRLSIRKRRSIVKTGKQVLSPFKMKPINM